ncbi:MAG: arginine repressor [Syntrophomonadaceae bacterium]|nr:arginine repressor [Syntrophomonadaceae bacterium]
MKARRHFAILEIVANERVATQEELCALLRARGFEVTQATVSRDIKELKLVKVSDRLGYRYALPDSSSQRYSQDRMRRLFNDAVISIEHNESMVVIKTLPGTAHAVASTIDAADLEGVLGTVAGDDTILVVLRAQSHLADTVARFRGLIGPR